MLAASDLALISGVLLTSISANAQEQPLPDSTVKLCQDLCVKDCMGNDTPTERAKCLEREKCSARAPCPTIGSGASFSIDRGPGGGIYAKCADVDSTRQCLDAIGPFISPGVFAGNWCCSNCLPSTTGKITCTGCTASAKGLACGGTTPTKLDCPGPTTETVGTVTCY